MAIPYGVIGTNWITGSWITAATKSGGWTLHCVYSRTAAQAQAYATQHNCATIHTSLDSLAADPGLRAVYIASPNSLHHAQAKQLLRAGKHVILEKPATSTPAELDDLFATARAHNVFCIEAYRHIQEANFKRLQAILAAGTHLGTIYGASFPFASYSSRYTSVLAGETPNIFSLDFSGGSLVDVGVYPITFAVALFGAPTSATYVPHVCRTGADAGGLILLRYETFGVQINASKAWTSGQAGEIYGEKGTLAIDCVTETTIRGLKLTDPRTKETVELAGPWKGDVVKPDVNMEEEAVEFARILREGDEDAVEELARISRIVVGVTADLRRQNGIVFAAEREEGEVSN